MGRELHDVTLAAYLAELHDAGLASSSASMVAVALPNVPEGLHADGQLASSHGHAPGSWSPAYIVVSAGCARWRLDEVIVNNQQPCRSAPGGRGESRAPVNPCPGSLPSTREAPAVLPRFGGLKAAPPRAW